MSEAIRKQYCVGGVWKDAVAKIKVGGTWK